MTGKYNTGLTAMVRERLKGFGTETFTIGSLASDIGQASERGKIKDVIKDLLRRGEVSRFDRGRFRYVREGPFGPEILRAMYARREFSVREVSLLSDGHRPTVGKVVRRLVELGDLMPRGRKTSPRGKEERVFRVRDPDAFFLKYVRQPGKA